MAVDDAGDDVGQVDVGKAGRISSSRTVSGMASACAAAFTGTAGVLGRLAASLIASASLRSFSDYLT